VVGVAFAIDPARAPRDALTDAELRPLLASVPTHTAETAPACRLTFNPALASPGTLHGSAATPKPGETPRGAGQARRTRQDGEDQDDGGEDRATRRHGSRRLEARAVGRVAETERRLARIRMNVDHRVMIRSGSAW